MPGRGRFFMSEELVTETVVDILATGINAALADVWKLANQNLERYGFDVPATPAPVIEREDFHRFDLKAKFSKGRNTFLVGAAADSVEVDRGIFLNEYELTVAYNQGTLVEEDDIKRDYVAFRVRDAVINILSGDESERLNITNEFNPKIKLTEVVNTRGEGFSLSYSLGG